METLAYQYLACKTEFPDDRHPIRNSNLLKLNWQRFSSRTGIRFFSLIIGVLIAGFTNAALATGALQQGATGAAVSELQDRLREAGCFDGPSTGYFGEQTREAVIQCQQQFGLTPDGIAGTETLDALAGGGQATPTDSYNGQTPSYGRTPSYGEVLQLGDRGDAVRQVQQRLQDLGYFYGTPDGVFGQDTEASVVQLQRDRGLLEDGIVGSQVYAILQGRGTGTGTPLPRPPISETPLPGGGLTIGDRGERVTELQRRLSEEGYAVHVDGVYGEDTRSAVLAYQQSRGLQATGVANAQTLATLGISTDVAEGITRNRYVVIIPTPNQEALAKIQTIVPTAVARADRRGDYVQVGTFPTQEAARRKSQSLRSRGLDARVIYHQ
jgi:peptidoglycan hydrolase-like protein with peptidoglycan-binding domain